MPKINDPKNFELRQQLAKLAGYASYERDLGRDLDAQYRAEKVAKMQAVSDELDDKILQAKHNGATVQSIADAIGTKNRKKVYDAMDRAAKRTTELPDYDPLSDRYSVEDNQIRITLTSEEITETFAHFGQRDHPEAPNSALFAKMGQAWIFQGNNWLGKYEHPVSLWWSITEHQAEMERWAVGKIETTTAVEAPVVSVGMMLDDDEEHGE
jgi:hypothetical protein